MEGGCLAEYRPANRREGGHAQIAAGRPGDAGTESSGLTGGPLPEVDSGGEHHDSAGDIDVGDAGQRGPKHQPSAAHLAGAVLGYHRHRGRLAEPLPDRMVIHGMGAERDREPEPGTDNGDAEHAEPGSVQHRAPGTRSEPDQPPSSSRRRAHHRGDQTGPPADSGGGDCPGGERRRHQSHVQPRRRLRRHRSDPDHWPQFLQPGRSDAVDLAELIDAAEPAVALSPGHDRRGGDRSDAG